MIFDSKFDWLHGAILEAPINQLNFNTMKKQDWPEDKEALTEKLKNICKAIDSKLAPITPVDVLIGDGGEEFYAKKFKKLFLKENYPYDKQPVFNFKFVNKLCTGGVSIYITLKDSTGESNIHFQL